jgi:alkanesulfonate monooxygenase SsuD/methylene tetrahydromethanopterin reductase-like flavin-dependent oxidoreductase (luciferase family)/predicted kinase
MPSSPDEPLPDPALVVLVGASGSGKSVWAAERYRTQEIVSSDDLRGIVGSGPHDLGASDDAFALLDLIVAGRLRRRLTTVVDTLGLDAEVRRGYADQARQAGIASIVVLLDTPSRLCRQRNAARDRPVPASVLTGQLRRVRDAADAIPGEGWDHVVIVSAAEQAPPAGSLPRRPPEATPVGAVPVGAVPVAAVPVAKGQRRMGICLQISRFPWGEDPVGWLRSIALAADEAGLEGVALMDHLIQIPQVDRAWEPIPEPWVTLGMLAGLDTRLRLGTLVTPVSMRPAGIIAKAVATLDVLSDGRAFCGIGAGWWEREHAAFGLPFPPAPERLDMLETAIETLRALWSPGTKAYDGDRVNLPETTCYPRPVSDVPIIVGGGGERRTLQIAARLGDGCNIRNDPATLDHKLAVLRQHCEVLGRDVDELLITVLDLPVVGRDRDDVWARVERLRGSTPAAVFAERRHAGTVDDQRRRYERLSQRGVDTVFVALPDLETPDDVLALAPLAQAFA